jgi:membrane protein required for colicin V production
MAGYDVAMIALILGATVHGAWRGAALQVAPIVSLVLGYAVAAPLSSALAPWFGSEAPTNRLIALLVVYLVVSFSVYLLARALRETIAQFKLEAYDHHVGSILGATKGVLAAMIVTFFLVAVSARAGEYIVNTHSGYAAAVVMDQLHAVIPAEIHDRMHPYIHSLDHAKGHEPSHEEAQTHEHATVEPVVVPTHSENGPNQPELQEAILELARRVALEVLTAK